MADYLHIEGPDHVLDLGMEISAMADEVRRKAEALKARLAEVAATRPWGDDMFGEQFVTEYNRPLEGGTTPVSDVMGEELAQTGEKLKRAGDVMTSAMLSYEAQDVLGGQEIARDSEV